MRPTVVAPQRPVPQAATSLRHGLPATRLAFAATQVLHRRARTTNGASLLDPDALAIGQFADLFFGVSERSKHLAAVLSQSWGGPGG
jgi:hypothetical protein